MICTWIPKGSIDAAKSIKCAYGKSSGSELLSVCYFALCMLPFIANSSSFSLRSKTTPVAMSATHQLNPCCTVRDTTQGNLSWARLEFLFLCEAGRVLHYFQYTLVSFLFFVQNF